jgi:hypothetical protein
MFLSSYIYTVAEWRGQRGKKPRREGSQNKMGMVEECTGHISFKKLSFQAIFSEGLMWILLIFCCGFSYF